MKPNVLKKISSVIILIIIQIMLFPNVIAGKCEVKLEEKCFNSPNQGYLRVVERFQNNKTTYRVTTKRFIEGKYDVCSIQPLTSTDSYNFYLYDMHARRFICAPKNGATAARRVPNEKHCLFHEELLIAKWQHFTLVTPINYTLGSKQNFQFIQPQPTHRTSCRAAVRELCTQRGKRKKHRGLQQLCKKTAGCWSDKG